MNKSELVVEVAQRTSLPQGKVRQVIDATCDTISDELRNQGSVNIVRFGTFLTRSRQESETRNPLTGKPMSIPAHSIPAFKAGQQLRELVYDRPATKPKTRHKK